MSLVDILIWAVLLVFMVKGFMKGLIREVCSLLGLLVGGWAAFKFCSSLASAMSPLINLPHHIASVVAFILILLTLGILFFFLGHVLTVILKIALLGGINRIGGVVFGLLQGALLLCMLLYLGTTKPVPEKLKTSLNASKTARAFVLCGKEIIAGWEERKGARPSGEK